MKNKCVRLSALTLGISSALLSAQAVSNNLPKQLKVFNPDNKVQVQDYLKSQNIDTSLVDKDIIEQQASAWLVELDSQYLLGVQKTQQASLRSDIDTIQQNVINDINQLKLNINVINKTSKLANALIVKGDKLDVQKLQNHAQVKGIYPIYDYKPSVAASADYLNATPLVQSGIASGKGIKVSILDTGIDYTHKQFGGPGTQAAYDAAVASETVSWPQGIVKGGYDFVNDDPNPIDVDTNHGTHVSHSVSGIAPDVGLYVYSVCQQKCPGEAQLLALEASMDPNGDLDIEDRVDVVNLSLGGLYGDIGRTAVGLFMNRAVALGTNLVISAGNDSNIPFIVAAPSTTEHALSVGAMTHPTDKVLKSTVTVNGESVSSIGAKFGPQGAATYSSDDTPLVHPETNPRACEEFADDVDFTGKGVIINRGICNFTDKVIRAQNKGAKLVIIANSEGAGVPSSVAGSNDDITIQTIAVSYETAELLKGGASYEIVLEPSVTAGGVAAFSSRGPSFSGLLKPEITAPGTNIQTAHPGTGDGLVGISGTSFSAPITAGAVSMLKEALPERNAFEIKATIMNAANLDVTMRPRAIVADSPLAPISLIGAGLVDVQKAANLPVAAWAKDTRQAALSFGIQYLSETQTYTKTVQVKNFSASAKTYDLVWQHRFADDENLGALTADYPSSITIPAGQTIEFDVSITIDPTKLPEWDINAGNSWSVGGGNALTVSELDGALLFNEGGEEALHLVYHVLPRASATAKIGAMETSKGIAYTVENDGASPLVPYFYEKLISDEKGDGGEGKNGENDRLDIIAASVETMQVPERKCDSGYAVFSTFILNRPIATAFEGNFNVEFDLNGDGISEVSGHSLTLSVLLPIAPLPITLTFPTFEYRDLDFGNGSNYVTLQHCLSDLGLTAADLGNVNATVTFRTGNGLVDLAGRDVVDYAIGSYDFSLATVPAMLTDDEGNEVTSLAPGEKAYLSTYSDNFMMISSSGTTPTALSPSKDRKVAPSLANAEFSVDENTVNGTVIGKLTATRNAPLAGVISEYVVSTSTSNAISVTNEGDVVVKNAADLDYDAGLMMVELEVIAIDSAGNSSEPAMVKVNVMNVPDEPVEVTPVIDAEQQTFSVQENAATGTVIGNVTATDPDPELTPIANFTLTGSDSIAISETGELSVAGAIDYEATTELTVQVTAVDSAGNQSEPMAVTIAVTQDPSEDVVTPEPEKKKKSSGSLAWFTLLAAPLAFIRRRKQR